MVGTFKAVQQLTWGRPQREGFCTLFYPSLLSWVVHRVEALAKQTICFMVFLSFYELDFYGDYSASLFILS